MDVCVDRCVGRRLPSSVVPQACRQKVKTQDLRILLQRELSGAGRETRGVAGTETPLSGHCASVPPSLLAGVPFSGFWLWDLLPQVQIQLTGQLPWGTTNLGRASGSLLQAPGAFHVPRWPGAAPHQAVGSSRAGMGFILGGIHPWLSSTASTGLHTWWASL